MEYVFFGKTGIQVSELCLGTMTFGNEADETASRAIMDHALECGFNFFDTAYNYNKGETERIVGRWIGPHRHDIILASKVFFPGGGGRNDQGLSRWNIRFGVEESLRRLQTDYLDILYLHHWDENAAIEDSMAAVDTLVQQGKVIYAGVSNFSAWQAMKTLGAARDAGICPIVCMQPMYSLVKRQAEVELFPLALHEELAVVPYNAIAAGMLTGKYLEGATGRLNEAEMYRQRYANPQYSEITVRFVEHARARGLSPAALAVAWVMRHPAVTSTLIGARNLDQFKDTLKCLEIRLSPEERQEITALSIDPPLATDREPMEAFKARGW